jgi:hypothetical protein
MPLYRYYLSSAPGQASPLTSGLLCVEAASPSDAIARLYAQDLLPADWQSLWIHFLVWIDQEGQHRGFESIELRSFQPPDSTEPPA